MEAKRDYRWRDEEFYYRAADKISSAVQSYRANAESLYNDWDDRYKDRKYTYEDAYVGDSGEWNDTIKERRASLDAEADQINKMLDAYGDGLNQEWVQNIRTGLHEGKAHHGKMADFAQQDNDMWSHFENEEKYKAFQKHSAYENELNGLSREDVEWALEVLEDGEKRQWLQYFQGDIFTSEIHDQEDFEEASARGKTFKYSELDNPDTDTDEVVVDLWKPGADGRYLSAAIALAEHYGSDDSEWNSDYEEKVELFREMTEEEFEALAYCTTKAIEGDTSMLKDYVDSMEKILEQRRGEAIGEYEAGKGFVSKLGYGYFTVGWDQFWRGFKGFFGIDEYGSGVTQISSGVVRGSMANDGTALPDWLGGGSWGQLAYDLFVTGGNQLASSLVGKAAGPAAGAATMGISAAGNAYLEAMDKGYSISEAKFYGAAVGVSEGALSYFLGGLGKLGGLSDKLSGAVKGVKSGIARFSLQMGGKIASEGIEEGLQEVLNPVIQNVILNADADIDWSQVAYSALLGGLSAGKFGEVLSTVGKTISQGKEMKANNAANAILRSAYNAENSSDIKAAAIDRLTKLGEKGNVEELADLVTKRATGQELTREETKTLTNSLFGSKVAKKLRETALENAVTPKYESLEKRIGSETKLSVSENGKAQIQATGEAVDFSSVEVATVGDGKMTIKTESGKEVSKEEITYSDSEQARLVDGVSNIEHITPDAATVLIRDYAKGTDTPVGAYLNGVDEAFTYGFYNYSEADLKAGDFTGNLTSEQMMSAYILGKDARKSSDDLKAANFKKMRTAAEKKAAEKKKPAKKDSTGGEKKNEAKPKKLTITYDEGNGKKVSFDEAGIKLSKKQKGGVAAARILHKLGLGTKFEFFSSYVNKEGIRVFLDDNGVEQTAYSGVYRMGDGTIRIDLNAYKGRGLTLYALAHELTHFIQEWSDTKYKVLVDFLMKTYGDTNMTMPERVLREQKRLEGVRGKKVGYPEAYNEVVANAMMKMFDDGKLVEKLTELKVQDKQLAKKLWEGFKKLFAKFIDIYKNESALFHDTADLMEMKDSFEQLQNMFAEALVEASENYQASLTADENQTSADAGKEVSEQQSSQETDIDTDQKVTYHKGKPQEVIGNERREESREDFDRRTSAEVLTKGKKGRLAYAYRPYLGTAISEKAKAAEIELKKIGIPVFIYEKLETNRQGITINHEKAGAGAIPGVGVFIPFNATVNSMEIVGHEGFHFLATTEARESYISVLVDNIDFASAEFIAYQTNYVQEKYFEEVVGTEGEEFDLLTEEIFAYITGDIHSGDPNGEVHKFLRDYDAVIAAWDDLIKKQATDSLYSSQETDLDSKANPYAYNTLISKPDMVVTTVDSNVPKNRADVVYQAKQNAAKVGKFDPKTGSVSVHVDDIGAEVVLSTNGLKHSLDRRFGVNAPVVLRAGEILHNSIRINEMTPKKEDASESYILVGTARNENGDMYIVRSVINRFSNELASMDVLYAINAKKEPAALLPRLTENSAIRTDSSGNQLRSMRPGFQGPVTSSTISITELLDLVNQYFPDVLPEDVLKHYGYDARPEGDLGKDALYSGHETDDISHRDLLANAFESLTKDSVEYKMIQEYKGHVKDLNALEKKLGELNAQIREIRFTKGKYDAKRLTELETEAKNIAEEINRHDRRLLSLEASEPLRKVIQQERKKAAQKTREHIDKIKENRKVKAEQTELRHKIRKTVRDLNKILKHGNKKRNVKEDMKGFVSKALELADYLFTDHVSDDDLIRKGITVRMTSKEAALVKQTEDILTALYDNADSLTDEEFTRLDAERKKNLSKLRDLLTAQRNERLSTPVYNLWNDLIMEYASLKNSDQDAVKISYSDTVERFLRQYIGEDSDGTDAERSAYLKNMRVADMTTEELKKLSEAYEMILHTVRCANDLFAKSKTATVKEMVGRISADFSKKKAPDKDLARITRNITNKMGWDYEKLYYALDRIGSDAFTELVMNVANSEDIIMRDVLESMQFLSEMVRKYGYNDWAVDKKINRVFVDNTGKEFRLTLGELMSLYAYSRRDGAWNNIEYGGFAFGKKELKDPKPADTYKLTREQGEAIFSLLTKEQKAYAEEMQKYLSEVMGGKGNEVAMRLYGIKLFGEKNYFPLHIYGAFKAQAEEAKAKDAAGFSTMSNAGFTHSKNPNAKAPIVLEGFNEVWVDHVNEMSRYHGAVPALEDMRRVMNSSTYFDSEADSVSIKQLMENAFGKKAVEYFNDLYREANSGAITDKLQKTSKKLLSLFRKNAVAYSLSVLIQQPTSIIRAYAMIDRKFFGIRGFGTITAGVVKALSNKWTKAHTKAYNEMLQYAPGVTMAKEIGGFDTATGGSIRSYLLDTGKKFGQKIKTDKYGRIIGTGKAILNKVNDNPIANLPNLADKIAWIEIWEACKRETMAKHKDLPTNSEEFMQMVGQRFTEVIRATQVYDSTFSKSPMLKSKSLAVQFAVSFMNEPNTIANMAEKAIRDIRKGDKKNVRSGLKTAVVVVHSIIFTNLLKSIIYAMRDDDEDETFIEKYIESMTGNLINDFNPLNYIPFARDAWSLAQGYDAERGDMALVADAVSAVGNVIKIACTDTDDMTEEQLIAFDERVTEATWKLVESLAAFVGIPVKNIRREINGVLDHARIAHANAGKTTALSAWDKICEAVLDSIPFMQTKITKSDKLYGALKEGDQVYLDRLKATYKDEAAYNSAVVKALRENDPRIHAAAQAGIDGNSEERNRIFREIKDDLGAKYANLIIDAINAETSKILNDGKSDTVEGQYEAYDFVEAVSAGDAQSAATVKDDIISTYIANGKTAAEAEKAFQADVKSGVRDAYMYGTISADVAENILMDYADMDEEDAAEKLTYWDFCNEHPDCNLTEARVGDYLEFAEPANISIEMFEQFVAQTKDLADIEDAEGYVEVSKRDQVLAVIDGFDLTDQQKDALYLAAGYAESKMWDVPW